MTTQQLLIVCAPTAFVIFILNGVFHGLVAADIFDKSLAHLSPAALKMADTNPAPVAVLEVLLVFSLGWMLSVTHTSETTLGRIVTIGALFQFCTSATWSLANMTTFSAWPLPLSLLDIAWHTLMGGLAAWLIYRFGLRRLNN